MWIWYDLLWCVMWSSVWKTAIVISWHCINWRGSRQHILLCIANDPVILIKKTHFCLYVFVSDLKMLGVNERRRNHYHNSGCSIGKLSSKFVRNIEVSHRRRSHNNNQNKKQKSQQSIDRRSEKLSFIFLCFFVFLLNRFYVCV